MNIFHTIFLHARILAGLYTEIQSTTDTVLEWSSCYSYAWQSCSKATYRFRAKAREIERVQRIRFSVFAFFVTTFRLAFQITAGNFKYYYCYGYGRYEYMLWLITEILCCSLLPFGRCACVHHICDYYYRLRGILLMVPGCGAHIFNVLIRLMAFGALYICLYAQFYFAFSRNRLIKAKLDCRRTTILP